MDEALELVDNYQTLESLISVIIHLLFLENNININSFGKHVK